MYKDPSSVEQIPLKMPKIDFQNCSKNVKDKYNIEGNLLNSVIEKKIKEIIKHFINFSTQFQENY